MPFKKNYKRKSTRRRRPALTGAPITRAPRMTRKLRVYQNLTRDCRWFKETTFIAAGTDGRFYVRYSPLNVNQCLDFLNWGKCWEEFKVLKVIVSWIPAGLGSESLQEVIPTTVIPLTGYAGPSATFRRGEVIVYFDQGDQDPETPDFLRLITKPSAKLLNPSRPAKRWMTRPRGNPKWGQFDSSNGSIEQEDSWGDSNISIQGQNFSSSFLPGNKIFYYVTISYKVLFRGRQRAIHIPPTSIS